MKLDIPPTRMQLLYLKRRGNVARRRHKLLKDRQDELMRRILEFVYRIRELRLRIEEELRSAFGYFYFASSKQAPKATDEALLAVTKDIDIEYQAERILNLKIPRFSEKISVWSVGYGFLSTSGDLDLALLKIDQHDAERLPPVIEPAAEGVVAAVGRDGSQAAGPRGVFQPVDFPGRSL